MMLTTYPHLIYLRVLAWLDHNIDLQSANSTPDQIKLASINMVFDVGVRLGLITSFLDPFLIKLG